MQVDEPGHTWYHVPRNSSLSVWASLRGRRVEGSSVRRVTKGSRVATDPANDAMLALGEAWTERLQTAGCGAQSRAD